MELILQQGLPHQQKAIDAVCDALDGVTMTPPVQFYENPHIDLADEKAVCPICALRRMPFQQNHRSSAPTGLPCLNLET
ncbi:MAG: hypothetical protein ACLR23_20375 [Clostridia bacterium]